jgi:hypothetical protein
MVAAALAALAACDTERASPSGFTLTELALAAAAGSGEPHVARLGDGAAVASWLEPEGDGYALRFSRLTGAQWSAPETVAAGQDVFVNWADVPSVVPLTRDRWVAHWLRLRPDTYGAYDVVTAVSSDSGESWSAAALLNDDGTDTEHGFATLFPLIGSDGVDSIGAVWLDGRRMAEWSFDRPDELLGTSLRFAHLAPDGHTVEQSEIDALVCDCCQTDVALAAGGPIVIYRDRTEDEIRDVFVRRYGAGGWLDAQGLGNEGWEIAGCPVNGPAIAANGSEVAAVWFTAAGGRSRVRFARSSDGGERFDPALDIDTEGAFGQADVALLDDGRAVVSWWRRAPGADSTGLTLATRTVGADGTLGPVRVIAANATAQPLDVPEIVALGDRVLVAWTSLEDGGRVRTALAEY